MDRAHSSRRRRLPKWIPWVLGATSIIAGCIGLIQPQFFWIGVVVVYISLLLLALHLYVDPELSTFKTQGWLGIGLILVLFSWKVVLIATPMTVTAFADHTTYPAGTDCWDSLATCAYRT